jgi:5-methylcytosine-specific restriction endonuclease McrA
MRITHPCQYIVRHTKVKGKASPYNGDWIYWSKRRGAYPETPNRVAKLLKRQQGKCTHCGLYFTSTDIVEVDQIKPTSLSDVAWYMFINWVDYFAKVRGVHVMAVPPHFTSQDCEGCGTVQKSQSTCTHKCLICGLIEHRDLNAAKNIFAHGLGIKSTVGHTETQTLGETDPLACVEKSTGVKVGRRTKNPTPGQGWECQIAQKVLNQPYNP